MDSKKSEYTSGSSQQDELDPKQEKYLANGILIAVILIFLMILPSNFFTPVILVILAIKLRFFISKRRKK